MGFVYWSVYCVHYEDDVEVTNYVHLLLRHFYLSGMRFRNKFQYVGHMGYQKIELGLTRTRKSLMTILSSKYLLIRNSNAKYDMLIYFNFLH